MLQVQVNIADYNDYRLFLKACYQQKKSGRSGYSYRRFSHDLGFTSTNHLLLVIQGKRNLSITAIKKITNSFAWSAHTKRYFECLVNFNQAEDSAQKQRWQTKLDENKIQSRTLIESDHENYFANWYIPVIREIIAFKNFVSSVDWVSHKLMPTLGKNLVREAFQILYRLKMIQKKNNKWQQSSEHLTTAPQISSDTVFRYHQQALELSAQALKLPGDKRNIVSLTMGLSANQYERLKKKADDFRDEIQQELQDSKEEATLVALFNMQLFPVTRN